MHLVAVTQWVRAPAHVPPDERLASRAGAHSTGTPRKGRTTLEGARRQAAGWSPAMRSGVDERRALKAGARGTPTVAPGRKAAGLGARGRGRRTPPGAQSGAGRPKGRSGTWASPRSPGPDGRGGGPADPRPWRGWGASPRPRARRGQHTRTAAGQGAGRARQAQRPETGRVAVCAAQRTGAGGAPSPPGPTGGKARPGLPWGWMARRARP
jgi:hypothetical protein